jgi:hypothetical protein
MFAVQVSARSFPPVTDQHSELAGDLIGMHPQVYDRETDHGMPDIRHKQSLVTADEGRSNGIKTLSAVKPRHAAALA